VTGDPLTVKYDQCCRESTRLDFRGDPADELIAATSVVHGMPLATRDRAMRRSRRLALAW